MNMVFFGASSQIAKGLYLGLLLEKKLLEDLL